MKALVIPAKGELAFADIPTPRPNQYQALVRMEACGFCNSTDHKLVEGSMFWAPPFPLILGHESVGRVIELGEKVTKYRIGDLVTRPIYLAPPEGCAYHAAAGGFAEYGIVHDLGAMLAAGDHTLENDYAALRQMVLPSSLSALDGVLAISLSETASVLAHLPSVRQRTILVAGAGIVGLAFCHWLKLAGARVIILGRRPERLAKARSVGADVIVNTREADWTAQVLEVAGGPVDGLVEATGDADLARQMLTVLSDTGFASAYGVPPTGTNYAERWETSVVEEHLAFPWIADLLVRGWVKSDDWISHQWPFDDAVAAYNQIVAGDVFKGVVRFSQGALLPI